MEAIEPSTLVEDLLVRTRALSDEEVVDLLSPLLNERKVEPLVEYVASRLNRDDGHHTLKFQLENGNLRRSELDHTAIGNDELEHLAKVA